MHFHTHFRLVHIQYGIIGSESDQVLAKILDQDWLGIKFDQNWSELPLCEGIGGDLGRRVLIRPE